MEARLVKFGVVLLLIWGAVLSLSFVSYYESNLAHSFSEESTDLYVSGSIHMTNSTILYVYSYSVFLVPTSDISFVNTTNVANYSIAAISPAGTVVAGVNYSMADGVMYAHLNGFFAIVAVSSESPHIQYSLQNVAFPYSQLSLLAGLAEVAAYICLIVGSVATIDGLLKNRRGKNGIKEIPDGSLGGESIIGKYRRL